MGERITEDAALDLLKGWIAYDFTQAELAQEFGVTPAFMSAVLKGKKRMTAPMLAFVGVRREVCYFKEQAHD
jgi:predicted transcriptional regulator